MKEEVSIKEYGDGSYLHVKRFIKDATGKVISYETESFSLYQAYTRMIELEARVKELEERLNKHCGDWQSHNVTIGAKL
jgi:hypothetical protein